MNFTIDATTYRTPNREPEFGDPTGILLHSDEGTFRSSVAGYWRAGRWHPGWLLNPASRVSCHTYITRSGLIYELANDRDRTWHGGVGAWQGIDDLNTMLGIECEHKRGQDWPQVQCDALVWYCRLKIERWGFHPQVIAAHRWAAKPVGRKRDPTDLTDDQIRGLIARMTESRGNRHYTRRYRVRDGMQATIRQAWWREDGNIVRALPTGTEIEVDVIRIGETVDGEDAWLHNADGSGFGHAGAFERVE